VQSWPFPMLAFCLAACSGPEEPPTTQPKVQPEVQPEVQPVVAAPEEPVNHWPMPRNPCEGTTVLDALRGVAHGTADFCQKDQYLHLLQERGSTVGPWIEEIWVVTSPDAKHLDLSEAKLVRAAAAVPDVIRHDGRYYLFYGEGDLKRGKQLVEQGSDWGLTHGLLGFGALDLLVSDDGVNFVPEPAFAIQGLVLGMVVDPDVIRLPDGRFRLYYVALPLDELEDADTWNEDAQHDVYFAESDDLIHWTQVGIAVHGPIADPSVFCSKDQRCRMFSTGLDHSHSGDGGRSFAFDGNTRVRGFAPEFLQTEGTLRQYYNAMLLGGPLMTRQSSDQGRNWSEPEEVVEAFRAEAPTFARAPDDQSWLMYYHYYMEEYRDIYPSRTAEEETEKGTENEG